MRIIIAPCLHLGPNDIVLFSAFTATVTPARISMIFLSARWLLRKQTGKAWTAAVSVTVRIIMKVAPQTL